MAASQAQAPVHPFGDDRRDLVILGARQPDPETMECLRLPCGRERFRLLFALLDPDHAIQGGFHRPSTRYRAWDDRPPVEYFPRNNGTSGHTLTVKIFRTVGSHIRRRSQLNGCCLAYHHQIYGKGDDPDRDPAWNLDGYKRPVLRLVLLPVLIRLAYPAADYIQIPNEIAIGINRC